MLINPVDIRLSAHVAEKLLELTDKALKRKPDDMVLLTAHDALTAALNRREDNAGS